MSKAIREDIKSSKVVIKKHFQKAVEEKVKKAEEKSLEMKSRVESMACPFCQEQSHILIIIGSFIWSFIYFIILFTN